VVPDLLVTDKCNLRCKYCFEHKGKCSLKFEDFEEYIKHNAFLGFFMFGGEPLMSLDVITKIIDATPKKRRADLKKQIVNGTLIKKHKDIIKKYNMSLQISIDGPKHVNDLNRVYVDGSGSFDKIMEGIQVCVDEKIDWSIHGVCNKETLPFLAESLEWFYEQYLRIGIKEAISHMKQNVILIIFEGDYDDNDVDVLLEQFYKIGEWAFKRKELNLAQKEELLSNIFSHMGGMCGVGTGLLALDTNLNIYPCHRLATVPEKQEYLLGNIYKPEEFQNFKVYNSYFRLKNNSRYMYSSHKHNYAYQDKENLRWFDWCPATNYQTSRSIYYQSCKYNLMHVELNRAMKDILEKYGITGQSDNSSRDKCDNK